MLEEVTVRSFAVRGQLLSRRSGTWIQNSGGDDIPIGFFQGVWESSYFTTARALGTLEVHLPISQCSLHIVNPSPKVVNQLTPFAKPPVPLTLKAITRILVEEAGLPFRQELAATLGV